MLRTNIRRGLRDGALIFPPRRVEQDVFNGGGQELVLVEIEIVS